jgi:hypothetical protein
MNILLVYWILSNISGSKIRNQYVHQIWIIVMFKSEEMTEKKGNSSSALEINKEKKMCKISKGRNVH